MFLKFCKCLVALFSSGGVYGESEERERSGSYGAVDYPPLHVAQKNCHPTSGIAM